MRMKKVSPVVTIILSFFIAILVGCVLLKLPISIQLKCTQSTPSYFKIQDECPIKDKPFCII